MAKSSSRNRRENNSSFASRRLVLRPLPWPTIRPMQQFEDRRLFHPSGLFRPAAAPRRSQHTLRVASSRRLSPFTAFNLPREVFICARRKIRREVLFARGGAGSRKMRKPRRSYFSDVRC